MIATEEYCVWKITRELAAGLRRSVEGPSGDSEAVALGDPIVPVGDGFDR